MLTAAEVAHQLGLAPRTVYALGLYTVGAVLGHKDARSTQRYAHLRHETLADAVSRIGQKRSHR